MTIKEFHRTTGMDRGITTRIFVFYIAPAIHYTMGGIHINTKTQRSHGNGDVKNPRDYTLQVKLLVVYMVITVLVVTQLQKQLSLDGKQVNK